MFTRDIQSVFKKAFIFNDVTRQISIEVVPETQSCMFRVKHPTSGEFEESVPSVVTGESLGLNFNSKYISDCLPYISEESIEYSFSGPGKPVIVRGVHDRSFMYLVMPMNK
jgi:DNA polymerase III sliding clamp (beta) subunit (PCNA family)